MCSVSSFFDRQRVPEYRLVIQKNYGFWLDEEVAVEVELDAWLCSDSLLLAADELNLTTAICNRWLTTIGGARQY